MANVHQIHRPTYKALGSLFFVLGLCGSIEAAATDLASAPLASSSNTAVRPNVLFVLDDSGSMDWAYQPDYAGGGGSGTRDHCKVSNRCSAGETPFQTHDYNGVAYNPRITYAPAVNADGTLKTSQTSANTTGWAVVKRDGYNVQNTGTINLTNGYPEVNYCNGTDCKKNGVDTDNPFSLRPYLSDNPPSYAFPGSLTTVLPTTTFTPSTLYDGAFNTPGTALSQIFSGKLNVPAGGTAVVSLGSESVSHSGNTVTVTYTSQSPTSPLIVTGDSVTVTDGSNKCSSSYNDVASTITMTGAKSFTYTGNSGSTGKWTNTDCIVTVTHAMPTTPAAAPSITYNTVSNVVTVVLSSAHGLVAGDVVTVAGGSCDAGYRVSAVAASIVDANTFTYVPAAGLGTASNSTCTISKTVATLTLPALSRSGSTVTVSLAAHGLLTGDVINVTNASSGTCSSGFNTGTTNVVVTKIDNNTFSYSGATGTSTTSRSCKVIKQTPTAGVTTTTTAYTTATTKNANPYYFVIIPTEYCDSVQLTKCIASSVPSGNYTFPAPVRFCKNDTAAGLPPGDAGAQTSVGGVLNCQAKFSNTTGMLFQSARYGLFYRVDVVPSRTTYGNEIVNGTHNVSGVNIVFNNVKAIDRAGRTDCAAAPDCTYNEEMTNFANWYAYYSTRMQMMKTAAGRAFLPMDDRYRIGFITINVDSWANEYLPVAQFTSAQKTSWYSKFYAINPGSSTPLREALARAGRYFAGKQPGSMTDDPVEYSCQQNFTLLTTDGYWNGTASSVKEIDGTTTMGNHDNTNSGLSARSLGVFDGNISGASNTLADVAMYYYKTDLRNSTLSNCTGALSTDVCLDNVPTTDKDTLATQHMVTFTLGLIDGLMTFTSDYESSTTSDFSSIKTAATGCNFSGSGTCNWPLPAADAQSALDDLWHAAVNGRGTYYNARDPSTLSAGLSSALAGMNVRLAAAAASSTSSPNITQTDRSIFSSTYRTTKWDGEVVAQYIDPATGNIITSYPDPTVGAPAGATRTYLWSAQQLLDAKVAADMTAGVTSITSRNIHTYDAAAATRLKPFLYANLDATESAFFSNKCSFAFLTQCTLANLAQWQIDAGNLGTNMVDYLRGEKTLETTTPVATYRLRDHVLGDTVNAKPAYVRAPQYNFDDAVSPNYLSFKNNNSSRQGSLYIASNDGMLHSFNTDTGDEMWAYVPRIVMPNMYKLAEASYGNNHRFFVDGSPEVMDIFVDAATAATTGMTAGWHTILVAGLNGGGRGFYALDVTDPANPKGMWEICSDSTLCAVSDPNIGYSYGNPVITKRSTDGKWVVLVTSGYNNTSGVAHSGEGILFVLDATTGEILSQTTTASGSTATPSGLAKISAWSDDGNHNNTSRFVYGGDLNGDVWRFDLGALGSVAAPTVTKIATLLDPVSAPQSITTRPELADVLNNVNSISGTGNPVLYIGTGRYLGTTDLTITQKQSLYSIKDTLVNTGAAANLGSPRSRLDVITRTISEPTPTTRTVSGTGTTIDWNTKKGWFVDFDPGNLSPGERVNLDPTLTLGTLIVTTNVPETSACTIGGYSWMYQFDYKNGVDIPTVADHVVGEKIGNALTVGVVVVRLPGGQLKAITTDAGGGKRPVGVSVSGTSATRRVSWRELVR